MFKQTFRVSKATFILSVISHDLERQVVTEDPISLECRLGICSYRSGRGDYYYTTFQSTGFGVSTVLTIVQDVSQAIITNMWSQCITHHFPQDSDQFKEKMLDFEELWQLQYCWLLLMGITYQSNALKVVVKKGILQLQKFLLSCTDGNC